MEWLDSTAAIVAIASSLVSGVLVGLATIYFNAKGVTVNVREEISNASSAVLKDMKMLIDELRTEVARKDVIIEGMRVKMNELSTEVADLRRQMKIDTKAIIKEVKKH